MSSSLLKVKGLSVFRADSHILHQLNFEVSSGECVAMIGSNGAGKSTLIESLLKLIPHAEGEIRFEGKEIQELPSSQVSKRGIAWVPEGRRLFADLTVRENIVLAHRLGWEQEAGAIHQLFPVLRARENQLAGTLSGGEQQMLALARAMVVKPKLILIDEMSVGLSPKITHEIFQALDRIRSEGVSIFMVEQNASLALKHSERAYVLEQGRITLAGSSAELLDSAAVKKAYLGL